MAKSKENFLDYVPRHNMNMPWEEQKGLVAIKRENKGAANRIAQKFFRRPKYSYIHLDRFGSFVWKQIDGKRTVYEIGELVKAEFGDEAEPLYERLSQYIRTLHNETFIVYENKIDRN